MKNVKLNIFSFFSLGWMGLALINLFLVFLGWFNLGTLLASLAFIAFKIFWLLNKEKIILIPLDRTSKFFLGGTIALGLVLSIYTAPTIFGGRDEGSYSASAVLISQNGRLKYDSKLIKNFFEIYGPGKALNFPGFLYTQDGQLKSQFLPAYSSWAAIWYKLFGLQGLKLVNLFPLITFIFSFYLLLKKFLGQIEFKREQRKFQKVAKNLALWGALFLLLSFPILLFYKFTLSEIYFASLLWFSLYLLVKYFSEKTWANFWLIFIPVFLMPFARVEAFAIIFIMMVIFIWKDFDNFKQPRFQVPLVIIAFLFILIFYLSPNFFIDSFANLLEPVLDHFSNNESIAANGGDKVFFEDWQNFYLPRVLFHYNILPFILMGGIFLLNLARKKEREKLRDAKFLFPFFILCPTLIYLADANISLDHPWFLRRYLFTVLPLFIFYSCFFLLQIKYKSLIFGNALMAVILAVNLMLIFGGSFSPQLKNNLISYSKDKNLLQTTREIVKNFEAGDLILISQQSSGSGWSLISQPMRLLMNRNAVYFFNPNDLEKIDKEGYQNIYLISSLGELDLYKNIPKTEIKNYRIENSLLAPSRQADELATRQKIVTEGKIFQIK